MPAPKPLPPAEELHRLFSYDPFTGVLRWCVKLGPVLPGGHAGTMLKDGCIQVSVGRSYFKAHRIIWKMMTGEDVAEIDHRDVNSSNNVWDNLRPATRTQNTVNQRGRNGASGFKGVHINAAGSFVAKTKVDGKQIYLGAYRTPEAAHAAYLEFMYMMHGDYARGA